MQFSTKASLDVDMASALRLPAMTEKLPTSRSGTPIMCYISAGEKDAVALYPFVPGNERRNLIWGGFRRRAT